jgi:hypothetical protein
MAGLWELVKSDADHRLGTHYIVAAIRGRLANIANSGVGFTVAQILSALNALRMADNQPELTAEETADLSAINSTLEAQGTATGRLIYAGLVEAVFIAAEMGQINETKWRNDLGIN